MIPQACYSRLIDSCCEGVAADAIVSMTMLGHDARGGDFKRGRDAGHDMRNFIRDASALTRFL
ncbi:hypothetical protein BDI4_210047 [Burkholderia diffusa]|nr:hypothetical protein BDI4_210047 [Burkholderia diffusa]